MVTCHECSETGHEILLEPTMFSSCIRAGGSAVKLASQSYHVKLYRSEEYLTMLKQKMIVWNRSLKKKLRPYVMALACVLKIRNACLFGLGGGGVVVKTRFKFYVIRL